MPGNALRLCRREASHKGVGLDPGVQRLMGIRIVASQLASGGGIGAKCHKSAVLTGALHAADVTEKLIHIISLVNKIFLKKRAFRYAPAAKAGEPRGNH
jgi:hypothetical protein